MPLTLVTRLGVASGPVPGGEVPALGHGQDATAANTGRAGAAAAGVANYSATMATVTGNVTYSTTQTIRNTRFTGKVTVTGGDVVFEFCSFEHAPSEASAQLQHYDGGAAAGTLTCNWCDFDTGLAVTSGNFETSNFQAGERGSGNPLTSSASFTLLRCRMRGAGNNIGIHKYRSSAISTVRECYLYEQTKGNGTHADGIEIYSSDNILVQRSAIVLAEDSQSCVNITADFGDATTGRPVIIDACYIDGGYSPVLARKQGGTYVKNVRFIGNRFNDTRNYWGRVADFNSMNVTFNSAYQLNTDPTVVYWALDNVWASTITNPSTSPSGDTSAGLPHVAGARVDERSFYGGEVWIWNGQVVGGMPAAPGTFNGAASSLATRAPAGTVSGAVREGGGAITHGRELGPGVVGPAAAGYTTLTAYTGPSSIYTNGTTIEGVLFQNNVPSVYAANVTFRGCEFRVTSPQWWSLRHSGSNLVVEDCLFRPLNTDGPEVTMAESYQQGIKCFGEARGLTVRRCEFWGFGNAIEFEPDVSTQTQPVIVEDCYFHHAAAITYVGSDEYHHDGILSSYASRWVQVRRCKIHSLGNTNALAFQSVGGAWSDCVIEDSSFSGFGWTLNFGDSWGSTRFTFTGNDFSTEFAPVYGGGPPNPWDDANSTWANNHWRVPAGSSYGNPAWDGQFWWPGDGKNSGGHATDY